MNEIDAKPIRFQRLGRTAHMVIETAEDLEAVLSLDEARWVATLAPVELFHADSVLLTCLDGDGDQFIKARDFKQAIRWLMERLRDRSPVDRHSDVIEPDSLDPHDDIAGKILRSLERFRVRLDDEEVNLADIRRVIGELEKQAVSGAGVILPQSSGDPVVSGFITRLVDVGGGSSHPTGAQGLASEQLNAFLRDAALVLAWRKRQEDGSSDLSPLGKATPSGHGRVLAVEARLERYFALCDMVAIDPDAMPRIWPFGPHLEGDDLGDTERIRASLERAPAAEPRPDGVLRWDAPLNPSCREDLLAFRQEVVIPLLGESETLSLKQWRNLRDRFAPYAAWLSERPDSPWNGVPSDELQPLLDESVVASVRELIASSRKNAFELENLKLAEKLALYQRYLVELANNFVSFPRLYSPEQRALFEEGTLVVDGRRFTFAVRVIDRKEHIQVTEQGSMFVAYVEIFHQRSGQRYEVAVPVTAGTQGLLQVGKRGVFQHVDGSEWTARIVHVVDRPISLWEAICAPFIRLGQAVTRKVETITAEAEKKLEQAGGATVGTLQQTATAPQPAQSTGGMLAGGGIAIAAVGSSLAFVTKTLASLKWYQILYGLGGALLAVLLPSLIVAMIKLRQRDMSCILEGSRWGINARMRLTHAQRHTFTRRPPLPKGSRLQLDAYGLRQRWLLVVVIAVLAVMAILVNVVW